MNPLLERLRTLLILGRASNLPTVWSNLITGWAIAEIRPKGGMLPIGYQGPDAMALLTVLLGGSFLYIGGMYLNDFCDTVFDVRYCPGRPIPAGKISRRAVGLMAILWFTAGLACFTSFGPLTIAVSLLLIGAIIAYDFYHKNVAWAPLLMGLCRCLLYLLAASSDRESWWFCPPYGNWWDEALPYIRNDCWGLFLQVVQWIAPAAFSLGLYVAGISYLARRESRPGKLTLWPYLLVLISAIVLARSYGIYLGHFGWLLVQNPHEYLILLIRVLVPCILLPVWMAWLLIPFWRKTKPSIGRVVSGLLAGIVLLDIIVIALHVGPYAVVLFPLFILALLLQRVIPAT